MNTKEAKAQELINTFAPEWPPLEDMLHRTAFIWADYEARRISMAEIDAAHAEEDRLARIFNEAADAAKSELADLGWSDAMVSAEANASDMLRGGGIASDHPAFDLVMARAVLASRKALEECAQ